MAGAECHFSWAVREGPIILSTLSRLVWIVVIIIWNLIGERLRVEAGASE